MADQVSKLKVTNSCAEPEIQASDLEISVSTLQGRAVLIVENGPVDIEVHLSVENAAQLSLALDQAVRLLSDSSVN